MSSLAQLKLDVVLKVCVHVLHSLLTLQDQEYSQEPVQEEVQVDQAKGEEATNPTQDKASLEA